jgi:hypothetical protein
LAANDYHFVSRWRVASAGLREVYEVLADAASLPRWWPALYLDVLEIQPGDERQVGKVIRIEARGGWLPYKLNWHFNVTDSDPPNGFGLKAWGDFEGTGRWTLVQDGPDVVITYDWRIRARKPFLKYTSVLFKPLFALNHDLAMKKGEQSLRLEVLRRRVTTESDRAAVAPPPAPPPTIPAPSLYLGGVLLTLLLLRRRR